MVLCFAFGLALHNLDARTFHGDELGSVLEAEKLGRNANSIPYFALLRVWLIWGDGHFWLRSLSALAIVPAVAFTYIWTKNLAGAPTARIASLLLATNPLAIVYSQQVRFYAPALSVACFCLWAFSRMQSRPTARAVLVWATSMFFAIMTLLLNSLMLLGQMLSLFALTTRIQTRVKLLVILSAAAGVSAVIATPGFRKLAFDAVAAYTNADVRYAFSRGLGLTQIAKVPLTIFFFIFGESVYPLNYSFVLIGLFVSGLVSIVGIARLRKMRNAFWPVVIVGTVGVGLLYLVLDPLAPPNLQGAAPRYLIFILPILVLVLALGAQGKRAWMTVALIVMNSLSLGFYWYGDWSYSDDLVDWRYVTAWTGRYVAPESEFVLDGRSREMADYYFPSAWRERIMPLSQIAGTRVILLSNDFHKDARATMSSEIDRLSQHYDLIDSQGKYPLFEFVFDRNSRSPGTALVYSSGEVHLPKEIYGIEFQDIRLPIRLHAGRLSITSFGAFGLPGLDGKMSRSISLAHSTPTSKIWIMSNVIGAGRETGTAIATLAVESQDGSAQTLPMRLGYETGIWDNQCQPAACVPAFTWRKKLAIVGSESYPGSWQEFDASIFAAELNLDPNFAVSELSIQKTASSGVLYIWGIVLEP